MSALVAILLVLDSGECRNHLREVVPDLHCLLSNVVKPRLKQTKQNKDGDLEIQLNP